MRRRLAITVLLVMLPFVALVGADRRAQGLPGSSTPSPLVSPAVRADTPGSAADRLAPSTSPAASVVPPSLPGAVLVATPSPSAAPVPPATVAPLLTDPNLFIYLPATARPGRPLTVLVTLHGMGGDGRTFCQGLIAEAERNGWLLVAPTLHYDQHWQDPTAVVRDDLAVLRTLTTTLDELPARTGLRLRQRVLLYGFSRGAQVAHRFALAYPDRVLAVAAMGAGTYTLPEPATTVHGARRPLPLPFGTADLAQQLGQPVDPSAWQRVSFWIGVGGDDSQDGDVPAEWTPYLGPNRVTRAKAFAAALTRLGIPAHLTLFPGVGHHETSASRAAAAGFFRAMLAEAGPRDADDRIRTRPVVE